MTRTSTLRAWAEPMRRTSRASSTRSSFGCSGSGSSPISSRNSVPPSASSNAPARARSAPVKAPRSWPNSSDSIRLGGTAPQSTTISGPAARVLAWWIASAQRVLAGAGLAFDQHGDVGGGDAAGEREQAPHRGRSPPQPAEAFRVGERQLDRFVQRLEADLRVPELQRRAARDVRLAHLDALDAAAVGRRRDRAAAAPWRSAG